LAYSLLSRIPEGLKPILDIYENYVTKLGKEIVSQLGSSVTKNPRAYVDQLLTLHSKYYQVNQQVFSSDPLFTASVDKAFRTIINDTLGNNLPANGPETLARYCDMMMKKNAGKKDVSSSTTGASAGAKRKGLKKPITEVDEGGQEERLIKMVISMIVSPNSSLTPNYRLHYSNMWMIKTSFKSFTRECWQNVLFMVLLLLRN
jgi:hypothetical protein